MRWEILVSQDTRCEKETWRDVGKRPNASFAYSSCEHTFRHSQSRLINRQHVLFELAHHRVRHRRIAVGHGSR